MREIEKILLIGPGSSLKDFDANILKKTPSLFFGTSFDWFDDNNTVPTYWTWADPNSITYIDTKLHGLSSFDKGFVASGRHPVLKAHLNNGREYSENLIANLKQSCTLLYSDLIGSPTFYSNGLTTNRGKAWFQVVLPEDILPRVSSYFSNTIVFPQSLQQNYNVLFNSRPDQVPMILPCTDKFATFALPLVLTLCPKIKTIECVGFGDFYESRLGHNSSDLGYKAYMEGFDKVKSTVAELLEYKNVKIKFYNKNSYYYELQNI